MAKFSGLGAQVVGISVDHVPCLKAWAKEIGPISFPLISDFWPHGATATRYGVLRAEGYSERAIFLVDRKGIIRYVDVHDIDDQPDNEVVLAQLRKLEPAAAVEPPAQAAEAPPDGDARVTMYCRSWCPDCTRARSWLQRHGVDYVEVDVEQVPEAAEKVRAWNAGKLVTPTCDIGGTVVIDFDAARYEELLGVES